jgi:hypothetical protein
MRRRLEVALTHINKQNNALGVSVGIRSTMLSWRDRPVRTFLSAQLGFSLT